MFQNLLGRQAYAARRSGGPQGQWSGGHAQGGWARRSTHQTVESPRSDSEARPPVLSKQSPDCFPALMNGV
ncbi:unnamed protein product [Prunus armeniaca]